MSSLSWHSGSAYCAGTNKDGSPCGNKVMTLPSGAVTRRYCNVHRVKRVCGFCGGKPVGDAATWLDGKPRPPAPCPRCGETNFEQGGTGAILDGSVAGAAEEDDNR